jgi:hypothetical protein
MLGQRNPWAQISQATIRIQPAKDTCGGSFIFTAIRAAKTNLDPDRSGSRIFPDSGSIAEKALSWDTLRRSLDSRVPRTSGHNHAAHFGLALSFHVSLQGSGAIRLIGSDAFARVRAISCLNRFEVDSRLISGIRITKPASRLAGFRYTIAPVACLARLLGHEALLCSGTSITTPKRSASQAPPRL